MLMKSWLKTLGSRIRGSRRGFGRRQSQSRTRRQQALATRSLPQRVEALEERLVLSAVEWVSLGPNYALNGQIQNIDLPGTNPIIAGATENAVTGAVNVVLPHPSIPDVLFVGGVNGGVWRTDRKSVV